MEKSINRTIIGSFTLRDALIGFVAAGGSDEEVTLKFAEFFRKSPHVRKPFETVFREMMQDASHTFTDKCSFLLGWGGLDEDEARRTLENVWRLATGTHWKS